VLHPAQSAGGYIYETFFGAFTVQLGDVSVAFFNYAAYVNYFDHHTLGACASLA
jgi:hypothetical protein